MKIQERPYIIYMQRFLDYDHLCSTWGFYLSSVYSLSSKCTALGSEQEWLLVWQLKLLFRTLLS